MRLKLRQALRSIKSFGLTSLAIGLVGCQQGPPAAPGIEVEMAPLTRAALQIQLPKKADPEWPKILRDENSLTMGESVEAAERAFPRPRNAFEFFEEPPFTGDDYQCFGWQSRSEAFAGVYLRDQLVVGLYSQERVTDETLARVVEEYKNAYLSLPMEEIPAKYGTYYFWEAGPARLMVGSSLDGSKRRELVIAIGQRDAMDALRMSSTAIRQDLLDASSILDRPREPVR